MFFNNDNCCHCNCCRECVRCKPVKRECDCDRDECECCRKKRCECCERKQCSCCRNMLYAYGAYCALKNCGCGNNGGHRRDCGCGGGHDGYDGEDGGYDCGR